MATFAVDILTGNVFLFSGDFGSSTGGTTPTGSTYTEVNVYSSLPSAASSSNLIYLVRNSEGITVKERHPAGLYYSNGTNWRYLGDTPDAFLSDKFQILDESDDTKGISFQTSGITTNEIRTITVQDSNGTIAYLTDLNSKVDISDFSTYTGTTAPSQYLGISDFNTYTGNTNTTITDKYDLTGGTINGDVYITNDLRVSGDTVLSGVTDIPQNITYGTPRSTSLPSTNDTFNNVFVYGTGGPDLSNILTWSINWDLGNNGLYGFSFTTNNGTPAWFLDLIPNTIQTFNQVNPDLTFSGVSITNFNGDYWINKLGSDIVLVSKTQPFAIYLTNDSGGYSPPVFDDYEILGVDASKKIFNTTIKPHIFGTEFHLITDADTSTTSSTTPVTKLTMNTNILPNGRYKITVGWGWTHDALLSKALFDIQLNAVTIGDSLEVETGATDDKHYEYRVFYVILNGVNAVSLRYWSETSNTSIFDTSIELMRVN